MALELLQRASFILVRTITLAGFTEDDDFEDLGTWPADSEMVRVPRGNNSVLWYFEFVDGGGSKVSGTCDAYFFEKALVNNVTPNKYIISRTVAETGVGPITVETPAYEAEAYGVRVSNVVAVGATHLNIYARSGDFDDK